MNKISVRNSKFALIGLQDMINHINENCLIITRQYCITSTISMSMVEIGSYAGDSTRVFAKNFGKVFSIDPYLNGYDDNDSSSYSIPMAEVKEYFKKEILDIHKNVAQLVMSSKEASLFFKEREIFDFIYIDGNHKPEFVEEDIKLWLPKVKTGGWIGGHDYGNRRAPEVAGVVDKALGKPDALFKDTSWIKRIWN